MSKGLFPDFGALFGAHKLKVEAWITPPTYTGSAPFVLTPGEVAKAPEGSEVTLRVIGPGRPQIKVMPEKAGSATLHPQAGIDGTYEAKVEVDQPMRIAVNFWGERASFPFTIIADADADRGLRRAAQAGRGRPHRVQVQARRRLRRRQARARVLRTQGPADGRADVEDARHSRNRQPRAQGRGRRLSRRTSSAIAGPAST